MATSGIHILYNPKILLNQYDISSNHSQATLRLTAVELDKTTFGQAYKVRHSGNQSFELTHSGYADYAGTSAIDYIMNTNLGTAARIISVCPYDADAGEYTYFGKGAVFSYEHGGNVGELCAFSGAIKGDASEMIHGFVMDSGSSTETANGTAYQVGAVGATQKMFAAVHCTAASGDTPTCDVKIQSDDAEGFSDPTDRVTFTQLTAVGSEWPTPTTGGITDDWWRTVVTIGGTSPSFTLYVMAGVAANTATT